jgi:hypothetical protein
MKKNSQPIVKDSSQVSVWQYKRMLKEYIEYANKFGRHAGPRGMPKPMPSRKEVEAFMYLTGLFIRLAVSKNS